jgi:hypothetical protein
MIGNKSSEISCQQRDTGIYILQMQVHETYIEVNQYKCVVSLWIVINEVKTYTW